MQEFQQKMKPFKLKQLRFYAPTLHLLLRVKDTQWMQAFWPIDITAVMLTSVAKVIPLFKKAG